MNITEKETPRTAALMLRGSPSDFVELCAKLESESAGWQHQSSVNAQAADNWRAECAKNEKDSARIDWLQDQVAQVKCVAEDEASCPHWVVLTPNADGSAYEETGSGADWREAVDDAMGQIARAATV